MKQRWRVPCEWVALPVHIMTWKVPSTTRDEIPMRLDACATLYGSCVVLVYLHVIVRVRAYCVGDAPTCMSTFSSA
jgi:hypothetical protein